MMSAETSNTTDATTRHAVRTDGGNEDNAHEAVMTVDEVARLLRVNRKTAYELFRRGEIPGVRRLGRAIRIHRAAVLEWLAQGQGRAPRSRSTR